MHTTQSSLHVGLSCSNGGLLHIVPVHHRWFQKAWVAPANACRGGALRSVGANMMASTPAVGRASLRVIIPPPCLAWLTGARE
jgi:hypothetical protein